MRKHWLALMFFCAGSAQAQFVKNTGIVVANSADITVNGDWDNQGSFTHHGTITTSENWTAAAGYSAGSTGEFILTNTATKQFNHNGQSIGRLTKNGLGNTQVNNRLTVITSLQLQNGLLSMTGVNDTLVVMANATVSGTSGSGVVGKISRYGTGDLTFPMSYSGNYVPITIYQVEGTNPRVTISLQNAPGGYSINGTGNSLIGFPYAWKSEVVRGDTAAYVEVQYPTSLPTSASPIIARSIDPTHFASMGLQSVTTGGGSTKIKSYARGMKGLFTVAEGVLLTLDAPIATAATNATYSGFTANWQAVNNATSYQLDISTNNFATFIPGFNGAVVTGTSLSITGLLENQTYQYRLRALGTAPTSVNSNVINATTLAKLSQTISFAAIADRVSGDAPFSLTATASSGLLVAYSSTSDKVTLNANVVTLVKAGRVLITAIQAGDETYKAAIPVDRTFCIRPAKPMVAVINLNTESPTLTSNAAFGNQWYLNGNAISGSTNTSLAVTEPGIYKVQTSADDCISDFSDDVPIIVTGDAASVSGRIEAHPNPTDSYLEIRGLSGEIASSEVFDMAGRSSNAIIEKMGENYQLNVHHLPSGFYVLRIRDGIEIHQIKFIKR